MNNKKQKSELAKAAEILIGRAGGGINELISERLLGGTGKPAGDFAKKLEERGRLKIYRRLLPGGRNWITLTPKSARDLGLPKDRAKPPTDNAISDAIAKITFCHLSPDGKCRYPIEVTEASALLGAKLPNNVSHVLTDEFGEPVMLRLYRVSNSTSKTVATLEKYVSNAVETIPSWIGDLDYGFAVLCPTAASTIQTKLVIGRAKIFERARILVAEAPNSEHLNAYLKRRKKRNRKK